MYSNVGDGFATHLTYINADGLIVLFGGLAVDVSKSNSRTIFQK